MTCPRPPGPDAVRAFIPLSSILSPIVGTRQPDSLTQGLGSALADSYTFGNCGGRSLSWRVGAVTSPVAFLPASQLSPFPLPPTEPSDRGPQGLPTQPQTRQCPEGLDTAMSLLVLPLLPACPRPEESRGETLREADQFKSQCLLGLQGPHL